MRIAILASASLAFAVAAALFDPAPADAAAQRKVTTRKVIRAPVVKRQLVAPRTLRHVKKTPTLKVEKKLITKTPLINKDTGVALMRKGGPYVRFGKADIGKLPISKAVAGTATLRGRVGLPKNVQPKLSLIKAPQANLHPRMAPFVQRHWKKAFFWVAVAGIGYLTIPEIYYDRFLGYVSVDDPDYEDCITLLSQAALEEEEEIIRVRRPMPANAAYRYSAKVAPEEVKQASGPSCAFDPFIERNWSRPFVWVQIPQIGSVTVPEDYYDRFYGFVSAEPANYSAACAVLVEAAAADTVATTSLGFQQPELQ